MPPLQSFKGDASVELGLNLAKYFYLKNHPALPSILREKQHTIQSINTTMGKSKPRNRQRNRQDPTSKAAKPPSDPELASIREQRILPVLKDLTSAELETRSSAAKAIANLIEDSKCRKLLLREKIVQILFEQTLTDSSLETRASGWGILRNLALEEEADFCIHLYRQDILTAIEGTIKTVCIFSPATLAETYSFLRR